MEDWFKTGKGKGQLTEAGESVIVELGMMPSDMYRNGDAERPVLKAGVFTLLQQVWKNGVPVNV